MVELLNLCTSQYTKKQLLFNRLRKKQLLLQLFHNLSIKRVELYFDCFEQLYYEVILAREHFHFFSRNGSLTHGGLNFVKNLSITTTQIAINGYYSSFKDIFYSNSQINPNFWGQVSRNNIETFQVVLPFIRQKLTIW